MKSYISYRFILFSIIFFIVFSIRIYLTIYSVEKFDNGIISLPKSIVPDYICAQSSSNSKGYFRVDFIDHLPIDYRKICKSNDILLIYILSKIDHFQRREKIRQTWANKNQYEQLFRTCFIFLIGLEKNFSFNSEIISEASIYGDIVQLNINESYQSIVYKEVGGLKWSHLYASHIPYLFKTDDDMVIDTILLSDITRFFIEGGTSYSDYFEKYQKMKEFTQQMAVINKYTLFKGMSIVGKKTIRTGKFGLQHVAWNHDTLPEYCSGMGYMFSSFIRDRLYRASLCYATEYVAWTGDLFVSGFLARAAAVQCGSWKMEYSQSTDGCSSYFQNQPRLLLCSTPMHMGQLYMEDYEQAWTTILHRHSITKETIEKGKEKRMMLLKQQSEEKRINNRTNKR